jgi:pSer/pThr/pTyr-binding forkhead associated (FHA) protein
VPIGTSKDLTFSAKLITLASELIVLLSAGGEMAQYQLVMHSGPTPGKTFPMEGDVLTIGREAGNQIVINDAEVSRKHTQFVLQGGKYVVTDLGSTNGTFVNGQRVTTQHVLQPGEVISLGEQITLLFEAVTVVDPNATMLSAGKPPAAARSAPRPRPQPVEQQPAPYAGQVPAGPSYSAPVAEAPKKNNTPMLIGVGCLVLVCLCGSSLFLIDYLNLWCSISFNMIAGC